MYYRDLPKFRRGVRPILSRLLFGCRVSLKRVVETTPVYIYNMRKKPTVERLSSCLLS
jgi:hypothetical protein